METWKGKVLEIQVTRGTGRERCGRNISGELAQDFANTSKRCRPTVQGAVHTPSRGNTEKTTPQQTIAKQPFEKEEIRDLGAAGLGVE